MTRLQCSCGKPFYAWHNPKCSKHPLPDDGSPCECCGQVIPLTDEQIARIEAAR